MAILRNPEMAAFDITEGVMNLTSNSLWGNSSDTLKELAVNLVNMKNKMRSELLTCAGKGWKNMRNIEEQRIDQAIAVLHDYFKKHYIR